MMDVNWEIWSVVIATVITAVCFVWPAASSFAAIGCVKDCALAVCLSFLSVRSKLVKKRKTGLSARESKPHQTLARGRILKR